MVVLNHPYLGKEVVLVSKHEKLKLIKPAFDQLVGCELIEVSIDTDQLGTFSGEIERLAPPRETAILKARLGMKETKSFLALASEGSVGPDPLISFTNSNIEHLVLVDDENDIVISEFFRSFEITVTKLTVAPDQDLTEFLLTADFPNHGLIVRPNSEKISNCIKGITSFEDLVQAIKISSKTSPDGLVVVESDLRALYSPSRQKNIEQVANLLARRVIQLCPNCQSPGWGQVGYEKGLVCVDCDQLNPNAIRQEKLGCVKCDYADLGKVIAITLDPANCNYCNP